MRLLFHKIIVLSALGLLLAHNLIPHHHHDEKASIEAEHRHHEDGHDHDHLPLAFFHVDEVFLFKTSDLKLPPLSAIVAIVPCAVIFEEISKTKPSGFISNPSGQPPSPQFLTAFSFRGPPSL